MVVVVVAEVVGFVSEEEDCILYSLQRHCNIDSSFSSPFLTFSAEDKRDVVLGVGEFVEEELNCNTEGFEGDWEDAPMEEPHKREEDPEVAVAFIEEEKGVEDPKEEPNIDPPLLLVFNLLDPNIVPPDANPDPKVEPAPKRLLLLLLPIALLSDVSFAPAAFTVPKVVEVVAF